jgi:hypothetical protein
MEINQKITYGFIGLLSLIVASMGGSIYLTPDQLEKAYICSSNQNVVIADHLSTSAKTAYWIDEMNITKSKTCTNGLWLNLKKYAKDNNIKINILLQNGLNEDSNTPIAGIKYRCDTTKCEVIA